MGVSVTCKSTNSSKNSISFSKIKMEDGVYVPVDDVYSNTRLLVIAGAVFYVAGDFIELADISWKTKKFIKLENEEYTIEVS